MQKTTALNIKKTLIVLALEKIMIITDQHGEGFNLDLFVQKIGMKQLRTINLYQRISQEAVYTIIQLQEKNH